MSKRRSRNSKTKPFEPKRLRRSEEKRTEREQIQRRQLAISVTSIVGVLWGGGVLYGIVSMRQTGHVRISISFLLFLVLVSVGAAWTVYDWFRHH